MLTRWGVCLFFFQPPYVRHRRFLLLSSYTCVLNYFPAVQTVKTETANNDSKVVCCSQTVANGTRFRCTSFTTDKGSARKREIQFNSRPSSTFPEDGEWNGYTDSDVGSWLRLRWIRDEVAPREALRSGEAFDAIQPMSPSRMRPFPHVVRFFPLNCIKYRCIHCLRLARSGTFLK